MHTPSLALQRSAHYNGGSAHYVRENMRTVRGEILNQQKLQTTQSSQTSNIDNANYKNMCVCVCLFVRISRRQHISRFPPSERVRKRKTCLGSCRVKIRLKCLTSFEITYIYTLNSGKKLSNEGKNNTVRLSQDV
jgi:hypothetical protein